VPNEALGLQGKGHFVLGKMENSVRTTGRD
jgi:hypothetical protein